MANLSTHSMVVGTDPTPPTYTSIRGFCTSSAAPSTDQIGTLDGSTNSAALSWGSSVSLGAVYTTSNPGGTTMYVEFSGPGGGTTAWDYVEVGTAKFYRTSGSITYPGTYRTLYAWTGASSLSNGATVSVKFDDGSVGSTITQSETYTDTATGTYTYYSSASTYQNQFRSRYTISNPSSGTTSVTNTNLSNSHTITYNPSSIGTYAFTVTERIEKSTYDSFSQFWIWQLQSTSTTQYSITVVEAAPTADSSVSVTQAFTSGTTASATVSGSGGVGGTITYLLKTSSATPSVGDSGWQSSNSFTGLTRGSTYYGWTKRTTGGGSAISTVSGSATMVYNSPSSTGFISASNSSIDDTIELTNESTFIVKLRLLQSGHQYRIVFGGTTALDWFTPTSSELTSTGANRSGVANVGAGVYTLQSRRTTAAGGNNTTAATVDTVTVDVLAGTITYVNKDATSGSVSPTLGGDYTGVSFVKLSGTGTVNTTTGAVTYTHNEAAASRSTSVRATFTSPNNTITVDATSTQLGGAEITSFSYTNKNAVAGTASVSVAGTYTTVSYSKISGDSGATVNSSTGVVTWSENPGSTNRSATIRLTASRNGDTDTSDTTTTQLAGPNVSFSYANQLASGGTITPSTSHVGTVNSYAVTGANAAATLNTSTGAVTWAFNESASSRSATISCSVTNNGLTKSAQVATTQLAGATITGFSYPDATAAGGQILAATNESATTISFVIISGSGATVNSSNGTLTWGSNEASSDRSVTVRMTASRNGDTDTADAVATQLGGVVISTFSYSDKNAASGAGAAPTYVTSPTTGVSNGSFSITAGTGATINATTGVLTWTQNPSSASRSVTVSRTSSRNGDSDTATATATQLGAAAISVFSYSSKNAGAGAGSAPSVTTSGGSNSYALVGAPSYASVNSSTGVITWTTNEGNTNRTATVRLTNTRNGTTVTSDAIATQTRGLLISTFSYSASNSAAAGASVAPTVVTDPTSGTTRSYSFVGTPAGATINSSTGVVTWTLNESSASRTATIRLTSSYNGDTDTADFVLTQLGGATVTLSYANRDANTGTVNPTIGGTYSSVSYSKVSGDVGATINTSTGVVTWTNNTSVSNRTATMRATASRNGDTDTVDAVSTQLGGPGVSGTYTYANALNANGSYVDPTGSPTFTGTAGNWSVEAGKGATIIASGTNAGRVTFTANTGAARTAIVYRSIVRNGYTRVLQVATVTQNAPPTGGSFALTADSANLNAGNNTIVRATASGLNSGTDYQNRLRITASPAGTDNIDNYITGVTGLTGLAATQYVTTRTQNTPGTVTYNGILDVYQLGPPDGEGNRIQFIVETRTTSVNVNWSAVPVTDFVTNPVWAQANANVNAVASLTTNAVANGLPQGTVSYARFDANQPFTVNSSTGAITWERNPGSTSRTGTVTVTGTNAAFQPGGAAYSEDFTVTQKAGPGVSFSYPVGKDTTAGNQAVTANHVGTPTYSITSGTGATVNSSTGILTWTQNTSVSDRTVTVQASVVNNGDTRTGTAVATQYGGTQIVSFSYADKNAASGTVTPTIDVTPDSILGFRIDSGTGAIVDALTGVITWEHRELESDRTVDVELTATRNGATAISIATARQLGGVEVVGFVYPSEGAAGGSVLPTFTSITSGSTQSYSVSSGVGATIDVNTGELTWSAHPDSTDRTVTVTLQASRNGDDDAVQTVATQISQVVSAQIQGSNVSNSNEFSVLNGVLNGLAEGVTVVSYSWTVLNGTILAGQGTNQLTIDWSANLASTTGSIDLTVQDSLGRTFSAPTFTVAVTYVDESTPITGGTTSYGLEIFNSTNEVVLRSDEVLTRRGTSAEVDATRQVTISGLDSTSLLSVSLALAEGVSNSGYTVGALVGSSRTITFGTGIPIGTAYTILITR